MTNPPLSLKELLRMEQLDVDDLKAAYLQLRTRPLVTSVVIVKPHSKRYYYVGEGRWRHIDVDSYGIKWRCFRHFPTPQDLQTAW